MGRHCFVIMPFSPEFDGIWRYLIGPTVRHAGDDCTRADDVFRPGVIIDDILDLIRRSDYMIADLTSRNANVFYELGVAHALAKPVILLTQDERENPFDVRHQRMIVYKDSAQGAVKLREDLRRAIESIQVPPPVLAPPPADAETGRPLGP